MNYIDKLAAVQTWIEDSGLPEREILSVVINNALDLKPRIQIKAESFLAMYHGKKAKRFSRGETTHYEINDGSVEVSACRRHSEPPETVTISFFRH